MKVFAAVLSITFSGVLAQASGITLTCKYNGHDLEVVSIQDTTVRFEPNNLGSDSPFKTFAGRLIAQRLSPDFYVKAKGQGHDADVFLEIKTNPTTNAVTIIQSELETSSETYNCEGLSYPGKPTKTLK